MRTCAVCRQARIEYLVFLDGLLRLANIPSLTFLCQGGAWPSMASTRLRQCSHGNQLNPAFLKIGGGNTHMD